MRTLTTPLIRIPCSQFHPPNHRCRRCGIRARGVGKWKEAVQTQSGARLSAEEAIKADFSSVFSNIYYVFPFHCSTTERLSHLPAPASFLLSSFPPHASWRFVAKMCIISTHKVESAISYSFSRLHHPQLSFHVTYVWT